MPDLSEFTVITHLDNLWLAHTKCTWKDRMGTLVHMNVLVTTIDRHMDECTKKD